MPEQVRYIYFNNERIRVHDGTTAPKKKKTKVKRDKRGSGNINNAVNDVIKWINSRLNEMSV